jgi:DNA polymerase-1
MRYLTFGSEERSSYKICILVNEIRKDEILKAYITPYGLDENDIIVIDLHRTRGQKKTPVAEQKAYINEVLVPTLNDLGVEYLVITDGDYLKTFTKITKVDAVLGYMLATDYGNWMITYAPNYQTIFYDPAKVTDKITTGIIALQNWMAGTYVDPGVDIIEFAAYPKTIDEIGYALQKLMYFKELTCDVEGFSLKHYDAGIGTISFAWSKTQGIAFPVDLLDDPADALHVRTMLREFFEKYRGKLLFHKIDYDVSVLIYQLFMEHLLDNEGLLFGLKVMLRDWDDTRLIAYLATNSCSGNRLGLKNQAQEYAGNYAQENLTDIRKIPLPQLLQYNLVDTLATWFVYEKQWPILVQDQQQDIYETLFKPAMVDIIQMQLTGMPVDMPKAIAINDQLLAEQQVALDKIAASELIQEFTRDVLDVQYAEKMNGKWVKKRITPAEAGQEFNPNSDLQMRALLFDFLKLPVISHTDSKLPSTDGETIDALLNRNTDPKIKELLEAFQMFTIIGTLTTNFMPSILGAIQGPDGWHYLFGSFNLGGTVSGRLSSSGPNLQNLPSTGKGHKIKLGYAKLIKSCFAAPPGWFFCGIDFSSLEDRISALTTKDPNKLKVYTDGYDGHSLRAFAYWGNQMPDIVDTVDSINSIQKKYKTLRDRSKNPTFTLTYQGTHIALVKKYGFTTAQAKEVEAKYHVLYKVSDDWVAAKLDAATRDGYITAAFGLRVRTPLLHQVIRNTSKTPYEAEKEGRTAGNALGQSWGLLNSRAGSEFMGKVRTSKHCHDIKPSCQIHDAQYYLVRDDIDAIEYANIHVVTACQWQNHPDIWHDEVKLGGEFSIFYPDWSQEAGIPNGASQADIYKAFETHVLKIT